MTWLGDFLFLAAIALFAVFIVANRVWSLVPGQVIFSATIVSAVVYTPIWLLWLDSNLAVAPGSEILLQGAYQGLVPSVLGISCLNIAVRHIGPRATSVFLSSMPVVAALTALPILNELPGLAGLDRHDRRHCRHPAGSGYHRFPSGNCNCRRI
jgi:drug/metabolite transporter (DMT)-like permease